MKPFSYTRLCMIFVIILFLIYWTSFARKKSDVLNTTNEHFKQYVTYTKENHRQSFRNKIVVAVVACGDRLQETLNMLKSAIMFSKEKLNFIIIAEDKLIESFKEKLSEWKSFTNNGFTYNVMRLTFPADNTQEWRKLFKPCAAQRLFLPSVLSDIDSILYVDTDTLFLTPVEKVWEHFYKMNSSQMAALAPEHEDPNVGWYNRFARHPYYGELGVNSGVMLMNLTRMREFQWVDYVIPIYKRYKLKITWGDQDIINIIFHFHPDKLYIYSCRYNFRPDHCMYMSICKPAEKHGVAVIHGSRGFFHSEKQPVFQAIYRSFAEFQLGGDLYHDFYQSLEVYLESAADTNCGHIKDVYLKNIRQFIDFDYDNR